MVMVWFRWFSPFKGVFSGSMLIFRGDPLDVFVYFCALWRKESQKISSTWMFRTSSGSSHTKWPSRAGTIAFGQDAINYSSPSSQCIIHHTIDGRNPTLVLHCLEWLQLIRHVQTSNILKYPLLTANSWENGVTLSTKCRRKRSINHHGPISHNGKNDHQRKAKKWGISKSCLEHDEFARNIIEQWHILNFKRWIPRTLEEMVMHSLIIH